MPNAAAPVLLHIGLPKTGTTALQQILRTHREVLAEHGVLYPGNRADHFYPALDVLEQRMGALLERHGSEQDEPESPEGPRGYDDPRTEGAWRRLVAETTTAPGPVLISHEVFSRARGAAIERIVSDVSGPGDRPVLVVVTVRDLLRHVPAAWQEAVKNGGTASFAEYFAKARERRRRGKRRTVLWRGQDAVGVAERWADVVGTDAVRLVTVPPAGSPRDLLWRRFAAATGLSEVPVDVEAVGGDGTANTSLTPGQVAAVRRLNARLAGELDWPAYSSIVKVRLAQQTLAGHGERDRRGLLPEQQARLARWSNHMADELAEAGYPVVGDLDDLRVLEPAPGPTQPPSTEQGLDDPPPGAVRAALAAMVEALGATSEAEEIHAGDDDLDEAVALLADLVRREAGRPTQRLARSLPPRMREVADGLGLSRRLGAGD